jgi:hypothetical protein
LSNLLKRYDYRSQYHYTSQEKENLEKLELRNQKK